MFSRRTDRTPSPVYDNTYDSRGARSGGFFSRRRSSSSDGYGNNGNGKPEPCPCGRRDRRDFPVAYAMCCGRYLDGAAGGAAASVAVADMNGSPSAPGATSAGFAPAPDAESLMRSRYTAFVRERADYLLATWHASTRPASIDFEPGRLTSPTLNAAASAAVTMNATSRMVMMSIIGMMLR